MLSVIIPTCHRNNTLAACLDRLAPGKQTLAAQHYEVIVTDDGSASTAERMIRESFPWARWIAGPQRGPASNRNHGARLARGEWIAFTDDDCLPDAGWLKAFSDTLAAQPQIAVCEGRTYVDRPRSHPLDDSPVNEKGGNLWACNFSIRQDLFIKIGGFDERFHFPSMEDTELNLRLNRLGIGPKFVPNASVLHPWRRITNWRRHHRRQTRSRLLLEELYPGRGFPSLHPRMLMCFTRTLVCEHAPFALRHPIEAGKVLPGVWQAMILEILWCWRRPRADSLNE